MQVKDSLSDTPVGRCDGTRETTLAQETSLGEVYFLGEKAGVVVT